MKLVFANSKGGVGKSTLAVHCAVWLHDHGFRVAVLDLDKQRSSSVWIAEAEPKITVRTADTPEECLSEAQELAESHEFVIADGPAGLDELSRTLLLLADAALFPITPSILDMRSVQGATAILRFAQKFNGGRPEGRLILNKMKNRDTINLARQGVPLSTAQKLARHSTPVLTAARYTHLELADQHREVEKLPRLLGTNMGQKRDFSCPKASPDGTDAADEKPERERKKPQKNGAFHEKSSGEGGIRTLGWASPTPVFKTGAIGRSATSPVRESCEFCANSQFAEASTTVPSPVPESQQLAVGDCGYLQKVIQAWPILTDETKSAILTLLLNDGSE